MNVWAVGISLGAFAVSPMALAEESGVYIGTGVGYVEMPDNVALGAPGVGVLFGKSDGGEFAPGLEIGYRFGRNLAIEVGYVDLGELEANVTDTSGGSDANARLSFGADGVSLALIGMFPVAKWEPYVKAGVLFSSTDLKFTGRASGNAFSAAFDNDAEDAIYGLGVRYTLAEHLRLYVDSTYFVEVGEPGVKGQADFFKHSIGVIWQF